MSALNRLGRYTLIERIGEGGMAEVFRARLDGPMGFQKELAIKQIRDSIVREEGGEHVRSLINEARIGGLLKHPNIVEIYELGEDSDHYYIAMELIDGVSLGDVLMESRDTGWQVPKEVALDLAIQVCRGLSYAHKFEANTDSSEPAGVVHRDLKPSNIMITRGGTAKIMDFGIAKSTANLFDTTATGIAKGTPLYMSPEQLRGMRPLPTCSDLFSLGTILYEMVTGKLLFAGRTIPEIITRVLNLPLDEEIRHVDERIPGLGPVIARLLDRDVASRVREASDIAVELQHVLDWQEKKTSTAEFVQDFLRGRWGEGGSLTTQALKESGGIVPEGGHRRRRTDRPGSETIVSRYLAAQRRRRAGVSLLAALLLAAIGGAGWLVYKGTLGVALGLSAGETALNSGALERALLEFRAQAGDQRGRHEARIAATSIAALQPTTEAQRTALMESLAALPEETSTEFVRKYRALAWIQRAGGDYRMAMQLTKEALDAARQGERNHGTPLPPELLWEAGELTLMRDAPDASRAYFRELKGMLPPGTLGAAATAYEQQIAAGNGAVLRAELLYAAGDAAAWEGLGEALGAMTGPADRVQDERLIWAWRAMGEGRWERAADLVGKVTTASVARERRSAGYAVRAAFRAASGQADRGRNLLDQALKFAPHDEARLGARLQVARALRNSGADAMWLEALLAQIEDTIGTDDPDAITLRMGTRDAPSGPFASTARLAWDPATERLLRSELVRGGIGGTGLVAADRWETVNVGEGGLAWPFGPTWHPIDSTVLPVFVRPRR